MRALPRAASSRVAPPLPGWARRQARPQGARLRISHALSPVPWSPAWHTCGRLGGMNNATGNMRARRIYAGPLGPCVLCSKPARDRHHKDGDTFNNAPTNVVGLCRRCHMLIDGRLRAFRERAMAPRTIKPPQPCIVCGELRKPLRRGRCHACNEYYRRHGIDVRPKDRIKTHCKAGHPFDQANTYWYGTHRICRTCHMLNERRIRAARRQEHSGGRVYV